MENNINSMHLILLLCNHLSGMKAQYLPPPPKKNIRRKE